MTADPRAARAAAAENAPTRPCCRRCQPPTQHDRICEPPCLDSRQVTRRFWHLAGICWTVADRIRLTDATTAAMLPGPGGR